MVVLENVSKSFENKKVLKNINLTINSGEVTFIVGSSGAGKSTLLNLIGGLDKVSGGNIFYNDENITEKLDEYRAKSVGFVFQDYNLISGLSVRQNVELGLIYAEKESEKIDESLNRLGIKDVRQSVETLSGGEKQRAAIVRSICKDSEIIIADEPTGNLDSENANIVFELLVNMKQGRHIVIVSHDLEMARKYGDRIITLSDGEIVEDRKLKSIVTSNEKVIDKDLKPMKRATFSAISMVGFNSIKMRKSKIISIALVIALAMSMLALLIDFNKLGNEVTKDVNVNYLESDLISVFYPSMPNLGYKETPFTEEKITYIRDKYGAKELVPIYMELDTWFFSNESLICEASIKQVNLNEFFEERIMSYDIDGSFPTKENEIILAADVAEMLFGGNCIGKEIALNDGSGESVSFRIVGINNTVNPFDEIYSVVSSAKIKELYENKLQTSLNNRIELFKYKTEKPKEAVSVYTGGVHAAMSEITGDESCIYGANADDKNDILISSQLLPYILSDFGIEQGNVEQLFKEKIALKHNGVHEVYITGVYMSEELEIRLNCELVTELKAIKPTVLDVYIPQSVNVSEIKNSINSEEEFTCHLQLENLKNSVAQQTSYFKLTLIAVGGIMVLVSVAMLASFSKLVVLERRQEIAILKSLGATDKSIMLTLWFDSLTISILACIFSFILTGLCVVALPHFIEDISFMKFNYPLGALLSLGICVLICVCIYTLTGMRKLVRKMPAELFKH